MSIGLRERLLEEIDRRLAEHFYVCEKCGYLSRDTAEHSNRAGRSWCFYSAIDTHAREHEPLRALRREVESHKQSTQGGWCSCCGAVDATLAWLWPCPSIVDIAKELRVANLPEEKP